MKQNKIDLGMKVATGVLLVVLALVIVYSVQDHVVGVGDSAPEFRVKTERGAVITPKDFGGKVLILNFWASWCTPCVQEMPSLNQIQQMFASQGLVVLGVNVDSKEEFYRNMLKRFQITFQTVRDPEENINYRYGTYKIPESYIIDRNGKVVQKYAGLPEVNGEWKVWTDPQIVSYVRSLL
jgi:cytochrome c biogenesis protein CcmG, thiol:disulfide interchange protein DsbE